LCEEIDVAYKYFNVHHTKSVTLCHDYQEACMQLFYKYIIFYLISTKSESIRILYKLIHVSSACSDQNSNFKCWPQNLTISCKIVQKISNIYDFNDDNSSVAKAN
jgi:hypothetical protein